MTGEQCGPLLLEFDIPDDWINTPGRELNGVPILIIPITTFQNTLFSIVLKFNYWVYLGHRSLPKREKSLIVIISEYFDTHYINILNSFN